jgi:hypothetical protein
MTKEFPDVEGTRTFITVFTKLGHVLNALSLFAGNICSVNLSTPGILEIRRTCSGVWLCLYTRQDDCLSSEMRLVTVREDGSTWCRSQYILDSRLIATTMSTVNVQFN